jgi:hypothetical protein
MLSPEIASRRQTIDIIQGRPFWTTHAHSWRGRHLRQQVGWRLGCYRYVFILAQYAFVYVAMQIALLLVRSIFVLNNHSKRNTHTHTNNFEGTEDPDNLLAEHELLLSMAWKAAFDPFGAWEGKECTSKTVINANGIKETYNNLPVATNAADIGIAFNPGTIRSVHQLHIHIVSTFYISKKSKQQSPMSMPRWTPRGCELYGDTNSF